MEKINAKQRDVAIYTLKKEKLLKLNAKISEESVKLLQIDFAKINNIKMAAIITNAVKLWKEMEKLYIQGAKTSKQNVQIDIKKIM